MKQTSTSPDSKHLLLTPWYLYYSKDTKQKSSHQDPNSLETLGYLYSIECFLNHYHHLKKPSLLPPNTKILLFRENCSPCWENWLQSGCLVLEYSTKEGSSVEYDSVWKRIVFNAVGEVMGSAVVGVGLGIKGQSVVIEVWIRGESDREKVESILLEQIGGITKQKPVYKKHSQSLHLHLKSNLKPAKIHPQNRFKPKNRSKPSTTPNQH